MSEGDSDSGLQNRRKNPPRNINSASTSSLSPVITRRRRYVEDGSDSDSGSSIDTNPRKKRVPLPRDEDSDSSDSVIVKRVRRTVPVVSDSGSDPGFEGSSSSSGSDSEQAPFAGNGAESDASDGQSEKCPICLVSLKTQELGTPESCDHVFCVECILEWSKKMNTCPVDRQQFRLILVRKKINGKIYRQIPIEPPQQSELEIVEDPTFCEICGSGDHEDRMLLCDGCDLGFHLECLNPPLNDVPGGAWFCNDCSPDDVIDPEIELFELQMLIDDAHDLERPQTRRRRAASPRLVPRTQLSERVRRRVVGSRSQNTNPDGVSSTSRRKKKRRKRTRIVYKIDEATGETVAVKKRRKRKKRKRRAARVPKTIKSRLAVQLGMCPPSAVPLAIPEVRIPNVPNSQVSNIQMQRHQAGIPALNIFGLRDDLDYFSPQSEDEDDGTVMRRRAPNRADVATMRRARAKTIHLPSSVSSSSDILGCILNNQEQLYSKKSKMSLGENGKVIIEKVKDYQKCIRQTPADNTTNDSVPTSSSGATNYEASGSPERAAMPTSTVTSNTSTSNSGSEENRETSSTYEQQSLCSSDSKKEKKPDSRSQTPCSESEIDIYSDIETVSTSKVDDDFKATSPVQAPPSDDDNNDSEPDMVIDTEKNPEPDEVTSTVDSNVEAAPAQHLVTSSSEIQSGAIQSSSQHFDEGINKDDDEDSEDGCPNFSIYSKESKKMAKNTDITLDENDQVGEVTSAKTNSGLYSDSEDETVVKKIENSFGMADLMTEDISEEERSYTPCLDERPHFKQGLEGLDTEMISDEDRNDFDETQEVKLSDDALEINAKENDLDFSRPEDYEEGEIVDKNKAKKTEEKKEEAKEEEKNENKENENANKEATFKKLSKSTKERNYRDKDKSKSPEKKDKNEKENSKREKKKRKEIQRYNVRAIIEKPRRLLKDEFGRDIRRSPSDSRSRSPTPKRSVSRSRRRSRSKRRSPSRERRNKRRRSRRRSLPRSRSRSVRRSLSKSKKRKRTRSLSRRRKSRDRSKGKKKRSLSRQRSRSLTPKRKEFQRRRTWTSLSRSRSPEMRHLTPSWTPPRALDNAVKPHNLTVILPNDTKKKKEKKRKAEKKKEAQPKKRKRNERTPPPSKEVFASGDNILVSVSFNKENETRDVSTKRKKDIEESKKRKEKKNRTKKKGKDLTGVKPVAIIDLERSPFKELTPSPKDVIVLSDSENEESRNTQKNNCDSSQQVESPNYSTGPKTPPEPQVKFTLISKQPQLRAISNPLHEPDEVEPEVDQPEVVDPIHKGPNTPPEPPNSPPSSPDVYDPFEPTKSRSPTPDPPVQAINTLNLDEKMDNTESEQKSNSMTQTPDALKSHTPPLADIQPADSQSSIQVTPESSLGKSPERSSTSTISQSVQTQTISTKTIATTSFPTIPLITSTPINSVVQPSRINILNSTIITPPSSMPQRVVLPSPVKLKQARKSKSSSEPTEGAISLDSPYSPGSSDYEDLFEPPVENKPPSKPTPPKNSKSPSKVQNTFDALFGTTFNKVKTAKPEKTKFNKKSSLFPIPNKGTKQVGVKLDEDNLKILDDLPNSAVEMQVKDKFLKKLNRQERVVEEVKLVLKPHYNKKHLNKDEYKDILRRAVPKICHNKTGEINPTKIKNLIEAYVKKVRHSKKVTSSTQKASG